MSNLAIMSNLTIFALRKRPERASSKPNPISIMSNQNYYDQVRNAFRKLDDKQKLAFINQVFEHVAPATCATEKNVYKLTLYYSVMAVDGCCTLYLNETSFREAGNIEAIRKAEDISRNRNAGAFRLERVEGSELTHIHSLIINL